VELGIYRVEEAPQMHAPGQGDDEEEETDVPPPEPPKPNRPSSPPAKRGRSRRG